MSKIIHNKTALITGASAGLGAEFAKQLAKFGEMNLLLVARRVDRLEELQRSIKQSGFKQNVTVHAADLSREDSRLELLSFIEEQKLQINLLINNAGFGSVGLFAHTDWARQHEMIELNCVAPLHLTRTLLPQMLLSGECKVVNVCSTAAFQPMPYMATYGATKAFLLSFSMALAAESATNDAAKKVIFIADCPGPTKTEFHLAAGLPEKMSFLPAMSAEQVVTEVLTQLEKGSGVLVHGWLNWLLTCVARVVPPRPAGRLVERILRSHR